MAPFSARREGNDDDDDITELYHCSCAAVALKSECMDIMRDKESGFYREVAVSGNSTH